MTNPNDVSTTASAISPDDQLRILRAMTKVPYAGSARIPHTAFRETVTVDAVVNFLEDLAGILTRTAAAAQKNEDELSTLRRDIAGVRRVFGTALTEESK